MSVNEFISCKIVAKSRSTPASTTTFRFSSRPVLDDTYPGRFIPIIESVQIGQALNDYIPQSSTGTIILNNAHSSYAEQLRFSDFLISYEIINQPIDIFISNNTIGDDDHTANIEQVWSDIIQSYTVQDDKITLTLKSDILPRHQITYEVTTEIATTAPDSSNGKFLPFVLASSSSPVEVEPVKLRDQTGEGYQREFGYCTNLSDKFTSGGVQKYYCKNIDGEYSEVKSTGGTSTDVYAWTDDSSGGYLVTHAGEFASRVNYDSANPYICTSCTVKFKGDTANTAVTFDGEIVFRLYKRREKTGKPQKQPIEEVTVLKSDYETSLESSSKFNIKFYFTKPVVMDWEHGYFVSISVSNTASGGVAYIVTQDETGRVIQYRQDPSRSNLARWQSGTVTSGTFKETAKTFVMSFRGVVFTDYNTGNSGAYRKDNGLDLAFFRAGTEAITADPDIYDLVDLDMVVAVAGIRDDSSGSISGAANSTLGSPAHAIELMSYYWNGSAWASDGKFDGSFASATHAQTNTPGSTYYRIAGGKTRGATRADQFIQELCSQFQLRICNVASSSGLKWGIYCAGATISASDTLYNDDIKSISYSATEVGSIVNDALMLYDERVIGLEFLQSASQNSDKNLIKTLHYHYADGGTGESISDDSYLLYGQKELKNNKFNFINDTTSAAKTLELIIRTHDRPNEFITFEIPYFENRTLQSMDTLNVITPFLPDTNGVTNINNFNPLSATNTYTNNHSIEYRAHSYKVQIINYFLVFNKNEIAKYRLTCKILNSGADPT